MTEAFWSEDTTPPDSKGFAYEKSGGGEVEWYTPPEVFEGLGLVFDLDPCAPPGGPHHVPLVDEENFFTFEHNGLVQPWEGRVWCNPPYGPDLPPWLARLADHGNGVALVPARTDTEWFHLYAARADAIAFLRQRVRFLRPDGSRGESPGAGSMLVGYGECADAVREYPNATTVSVIAHETPILPMKF